MSSGEAARGWTQRFHRSDALKAYALISPSGLFLIFALAAPVALLFLYSFWTQDGLSLDTTPTFDQYEIALGRETYRALLLRSIATAGLVTLITVAIAYPMAYFVAFRVTRGKFIWLVLLSVPFWTSYLLRVFSWKVILGYNGAVNSGLMSLGLIEQPLEFLLYNQTAVVVTLSHAWAAFAILPIYVSLEKLDRSLLEAAADLGEGPVRRFLRITLPLTLSGVTGAAIVIFVPTVGDYVTPAMVGGSDGVMIANIIQVQFGKVNNWPLGAALAVVSMASVAVIAVAFVQTVQLAARKLA